jgi:iron complex transport system substrate-binding protein
MRKMVLALCLALALTGCTLEADEQSAPTCSEDQIQLESVDLEIRIASTALGAGSIIQALGAGEALVATDLGSIGPAPIINPGHQIDVETLIGFRPEIIFIDQDEPDETAIAAMSSIGAQIIELPPVSSMQESIDRTLLIAEALGIPERGQELNSKIANAIELIDSEALAGKSVAFLYLRGAAGIYLLGGAGSGADDLITSLGAKDVGTALGVSGFAPINPESLMAANPDFVMVMEKGLESVGGVDGLLSLPGVSGTTAASSRGVLTGNDSQLLSFGPGTPTTLACIVQQVAN